MDFCKALKKALDSAPNEKAEAAVQEVIANHCTAPVTAQGGGNGNGPPDP